MVAPGEATTDGHRAASCEINAIAACLFVHTRKTQAACTSASDGDGRSSVRWIGRRRRLCFALLCFAFVAVGGASSVLPACFYLFIFLCGQCPAVRVLDY
jgi:hypothetical protein